MTLTIVIVLAFFPSSSQRRIIAPIAAAHRHKPRLRRQQCKDGTGGYALEYVYRAIDPFGVDRTLRAELDERRHDLDHDVQKAVTPGLYQGPDIVDVGGVVVGDGKMLVELARNRKFAVLEHYAVAFSFGQCDPCLP